MIVEPSAPAAALERMRAPFLELGAEPVEVPVLQPLALLLDLYGEAMRARLFVVQAEGGVELALRPDFTVAVAREHVARGRAEGRYGYEGRAFRTAPTGSDRPQEFLQIGAEIIGETASPEADAQMIALAWRAAVAGGRVDLSLTLGDVGLFDTLIHALGVPALAAARVRRALARPQSLAAALADASTPAVGAASPLAALLAARPAAEAAALVEELWAMSGVSEIGGRSAAEVARRLAAKAAAGADAALSGEAAAVLRRYLAVDGAPAAALAGLAALDRELDGALAASLDAWARRLDALERLGVPAAAVRLTTAFGRAFDYYDGVLFEVRSAALGPELPVAAGGRYDRLPTLLGAGSPGAVGCIVRPGRAWSGASA